MKRTLFTVMIALAVLTGAYSIAGAADGPHVDYRPDAGSTGYSLGCNGAACHPSLAQKTFLPQILDTAAAPNTEDYTNFCLGCHNSAGEAHNKSAGSPSNNTYRGSTTIPGNSGVSHSWNGQNHNAGTSTPTSAGFKTNRLGTVTDGTMFMPSGRVTCQTCHDPMTKSTNPVTQNIENWAPATLQSGTSYTFGYANTSQYLAKYIKVYRSSASMTKPANTRTKNQYLVDPSEYTYNYQNGTITFNTSQGSNYIYVEIPQPYLRVDNTANTICLDCHSDRTYNSVSHAPGTGAKNGHPVTVKYGYGFGLHSTLKPAATGNAYLESVSGNQKVLCTSCHDPHNAASNNGQIMREADSYTLCSDCHKTILGGYTSASQGAIVNIHNGSKHSSPTYCLDCHTTHNSNNVLMIKNTINGKNVNFQSFTGARGFGPDTGFGICEVCHSATNHHLSNNAPSGQGHHTGENCIQCHSHSTGFQPVGGCTSCHGQPPAPGQTHIWNDSLGGKHTAHMTYILNKFGISGINPVTGADVRCGCCHGNKPSGSHPENLDTANIDTTSPTYWGGGTFSNGGTIGKVNTSDDSCTSVACHSTTNTRYWTDTAAACDSCHEYPGSATNDWAANSNNGHTIRYLTAAKKGAPLTGYTTITASATYNTNLYVTHLNVASAYNATTDTYAGVTSDVNKCGKCHPNTSTNHMDGFIELAPNGYGAGGGNFNITLGKVTGNTVQCSNVVCHFSRKTPNWY